MGATLIIRAPLEPDSESRQIPGRKEKRRKRGDLSIFLTKTGAAAAAAAAAGKQMLGRSESDFSSSSRTGAIALHYGTQTLEDLLLQPQKERKELPPIPLLSKL